MVPERNPLSFEGSIVQESMRCQTILANLAYRITFMSEFLSAALDFLEFMKVSRSSFSSKSELNEILMFIELARKTIESEGVVPYLWASCPKRLVQHKRAYISMLKILQSLEQHFDGKSKKRIRVLLMPLHSKFCISKLETKATLGRTYSFEHPCSSPRDQLRTSRSGSPSPSHATVPASHTMLPPTNASMTNINCQMGNAVPQLRSPNPRYLWRQDELVTSSSHPMHRGHHHELSVRSSRRSLKHLEQVEDDPILDQENFTPEDETPVTVFRPSPSLHRFGIFLTSKSSMFGNRNRKDY